MAEHFVKDQKVIYKVSHEANIEAHYRPELSAQIIKEFGEGPFDQDEAKLILKFALNYYIERFLEICHGEKSIRFYQFILWLHEQATELAYKYPHKDITHEITIHYLSVYRRVLKFIIETGCDVEMIDGEATGKDFKNRIDPIIDKLLFCGDMILFVVNLCAEQSMIEDVVEISFDNKKKYIFGRRHHYNIIFKDISRKVNAQLNKTVVDERGVEDLKVRIETCFGISYKNISDLVEKIHKDLEKKGGELVGVDWRTLTVNLHNLFKVPLDICEQFFQGLKLDRANKMSLIDLACKPYKLNRYLYKPIIVWNVGGKDHAWICKNAWNESMHQYATNAIPWGKAPDEWMLNNCFKDYVHGKEDEHDKWLEDEAEKIISNQGLYFDRNVKKLQTGKGHVDIDIKGLGEVDFIIISSKQNKIYIVDCKHLLGRYDMANQRNDFNAFTSGTKAYNITMSNKIGWFNEHTKLIEEHFQLKYNNSSILLNNYSIEGIFIINSFTFYMYNSDYRIYTIDVLESVLTGIYTDPVYLVDQRSNSSQGQKIEIKYPYFKIPHIPEKDLFSDNL